MNIIGAAADWATLAATLIAIAGIVSAIATRARFAVHIDADGPDCMYATFREVGSAGARDVEYGWGVHAPGGGYGDGGPVVPLLARERAFGFTIFRKDQYVNDSPPVATEEVRIALPDDTTFMYFYLSYQAPLVPWTRRELRYVVDIAQDEFGQLSFHPRKRRRSEKWPPL